jgi:four helix bundle protein
VSVVTGQSYRDLASWQRAMDLVEHIYRVTGTWPKEEMFSLTNQIRRAAVSIPADIAEGQGRNTAKEFVYFLGIANGSLREVETYLMLGFRLQYYDETTFEELMHQATEVGNPLRGLIRKLRQ